MRSAKCGVRSHGPPALVEDGGVAADGSRGGPHSPGDDYQLVEHKPSTTKQIFDDLQPVLGRILKAWLVGKS